MPFKLMCLSLLSLMLPYSNKLVPDTSKKCIHSCVYLLYKKKKKKQRKRQKKAQTDKILCVLVCVWIWRVRGEVHSRRLDRTLWPLPVIDMLISSTHSTSLPLFPSIKANASETVIKPCPGKRLPAAFNEAPLILPLFAIGLRITSTGLK